MFLTGCVPPIECNQEADLCGLPLQDIFRMNQKQLEVAVRRMWSDSSMIARHACTACMQIHLPCSL